MQLTTLTYAADAGVARVTLHGNAITPAMPRELAWCVEQADLDPSVHVIALAPQGLAFRERAAEVGFRQAVAERDGPFGDLGRSTFKG